MQLNYRGNKYELPAFAVTNYPEEIIGKYRGIAVKLPQQEMMQGYQVTVELKYRGTTYQPNYQN
ncbi:MAG: DUF4278 domain-containing protein [Cyanosarcina radialis HA8281-LM2]|jgi:hypothetical protein|nr:DUF4278 domain-containing protein [Cyanosarcina radialis HA8281-LM2]